MNRAKVTCVLVPRPRSLSLRGLIFFRIAASGIDGKPSFQRPFLIYVNVQRAFHEVVDPLDFLWRAAVYRPLRFVGLLDPRHCPASLGKQGLGNGEQLARLGKPFRVIVSPPPPNSAGMVQNIRRDVAQVIHEIGIEFRRL